MKSYHVLLVVPIAVAMLGACRGRQDRSPASPPIVSRLMAADSSVRWIVDSALVADFSCDSVADSAFIGRAAEKITVAIAVTRTPQPYVAVFGVHGSAVQEAVCSPNVRLTVESLDFNPSEELGALEGFVRSISCKGLNLGEADCDALHMYWNQKTNAPSWWRL